jgi:hypothetical protein
MKVKLTMPKKFIPSGTKILIKLSLREKELILDHTLVDSNVTEPLEQAIPKKDSIEIGFPLDDLNDLLEFIAAEANHTENKKLEDELDALYEKLEEIEQAYIEIEKE